MERNTVRCYFSQAVAQETCLPKLPAGRKSGTQPGNVLPARRDRVEKNFKKMDPIEAEHHFQQRITSRFFRSCCSTLLMFPFRQRSDFRKRGLTSAVRAYNGGWKTARRAFSGPGANQDVYFARRLDFRGCKKSGGKNVTNRIQMGSTGESGENR